MGTRPMGGKGREMNWRQGGGWEAVRWRKEAEKSVLETWVAVGKPSSGGKDRRSVLETGGERECRKGGDVGGGRMRGKAACNEVGWKSWVS